MTRFVTYLLLALVFLLACFMGLVLLAHVFSFELPVPSVPFLPAEQGEEQTEKGSKFLSRLSLLPGGKTQKGTIAVMIENHQDARPHQTGLGNALMIYEFLVEGQISRFVAIFDVASLPRSIGPVRSLRPYFIDVLLPTTKTIFHAGGSPEALQQAKEDVTLRTYNGLYYPDHFLRDEDIAPPHNLFISRKDLLDLMEEKPAKTEWPPYELGGRSSGALITDIKINFFNGEHNVLYAYSRLTGTYKRKNGTDFSDAHPRNILILEMPISSIGEYGRLNIPVEGRGRALLFRSGVLKQGTWSKQGPEASFTYKDEKGESFKFAKGLTWVTVLPTLDRVSWGEGEEDA